MEEQEDHTARGLDMGEQNGLLWQHDIPLTPATLSEEAKQATIGVLYPHQQLFPLLTEHVLF